MNQVSEHIRRQKSGWYPNHRDRRQSALETMGKLAALNLGMVKDALEQRETNSRKLVTVTKPETLVTLQAGMFLERLAPSDGRSAAGHGNRECHAQQLVQTGCRADTGLLTGSTQESRLTADAVTQRGEQRSASRRIARPHRAMCQKCHELPIELLAQSAGKDSRARSRGVDVSIAENRLKYQARGAEFIASRRTGGPSLLLVAAMIAATLAGGIKAGSRPNSGDEEYTERHHGGCDKQYPGDGCRFEPGDECRPRVRGTTLPRGARSPATDICCRAAGRSRTRSLADHCRDRHRIRLQSLCPECHGGAGLDAGDPAFSPRQAAARNASDGLPRSGQQCARRDRYCTKPSVARVV